MKRKRDQILDPKVLFVLFENQGGDWTVRIPNAYGGNEDFVAPITEDLSLQFQPLVLTNSVDTKNYAGVGCVPLIRKDEDNQE